MATINPLNATPEDDTSEAAYEAAQGFSGSNANDSVPVGTGNGNTGGTTAAPGNPAPASTQRYSTDETTDPSDPGSAASIESGAYTTAENEAALTPEQQEENISGLYAQEIAGIQSQYNALINTQQGVNSQNAGATRAGAAASGALGSAAGNSDVATEANSGAAAIADIQGEEQGAESAVYGNEATAALGEYDTAQKNATAAAATEATDVTANAQAALTQMSQIAGTTPLASLDQTTYQNLLTASGLTEQQFQVLYNAYGVAATKPNTSVLQAGDGTQWMISQNPTTGAVESATNLGLPAGPVTVAAGSAIYDPTTNSIVAQGQNKPTSIPVAGTAAYAAPATAAGGAAAPGAAGSAPGGAAAAPAAGATSTGAVAPSGTPVTSGGGSGASAATALPNGQFGTWSSLGVNAAQASQLTALGQSPTTIFNQAYSAILSGNPTGASSGGMGSGAAVGSIKSGAVGKAVQAIMSAYGITNADLPAIAAQNTGLTDSLETAIQSKATITQYITKTSANLKTFQATIASYGSSGSPLINEALQAIQNNVTGDPKLTGLTDAMVPFLNEYAKVMQGSTGSVSGASVNSQQDAAKLLSTLMNKGQLATGISVMVQDMSGQINSVNGNVTSLSNQTQNILQNFAQGAGKNIPTTPITAKTFQVNGNTLYVGDVVPVTDGSNNTNLYQIEPDGSLTEL